MIRFRVFKLQHLYHPLKLPASGLLKLSPQTLRLQRNRLPAGISRVGHSRVGEQEERTLGYSGTIWLLLGTDKVFKGSKALKLKVESGFHNPNRCLVA